MKSWKTFIRVMKIMGNRCPIYLAGIFFMSTGWAMFSVMASMLMKNVMDAAQTGDSSKMAALIAGNVIGGILIMIIYRWAAIAYNVEAKRAHGKLCVMLFHHEVRLPYSYYETHHSGDFMSKLSYDLEKTGSIYGSRLRRTVAPLLQVMVYVIPMLILSWQITLCLVAVNLVMLAINGLMINPMRKVSKKLSGINSKMTERLSDLLQGMEQARMYKAGKVTVEDFLAENQNYKKASGRKVLYTACLDCCNNGFELLCILTFLLLGIYFVQSGLTTLGSLAAIYTLYGSFSFQFLQLGRYLPELIGCLTNAQNVFDFMEEEREPENWYENQETATENGKRVTESKSVENGDDKKVEEGDNQRLRSVGSDITEEGTLEVDDIEFCYREDKPLLTGYSMKVDAGESVAITGPSGCGKTTLSKLILGLYPMKGGDIRINGQSYHDLSNEELRKMITYVPQEPYLFRDTIINNIRMGRPDATDEEVMEAAKMAYAHDFILELEDGYNTNVGERGNRLSGGQRQRIAIARAILNEAPIVLLDEATSALDNESERLVNEALKAMKRQRTVIMIAHRPSTIELADRVERCG